MKNLSDFLGKYFKIIPIISILRKEFPRIVEDVVGVKIKPEDISVSNKTLFLSCSGPVKFKINLKKAELLSRLKSEYKDKAPLDIK